MSNHRTLDEQIIAAERVGDFDLSRQLKGRRLFGQGAVDDRLLPHLPDDDEQDTGEQDSTPTEPGEHGDLHQRIRAAEQAGDFDTAFTLKANALFSGSEPEPADSSDPEAADDDDADTESTDEISRAQAEDRWGDSLNLKSQALFDQESEIDDG